MLRSTGWKLVRVAKGVALLGGFAVGLALILGVATTALAAVPGDPFELGETNTINNALTKLAGSNAGGPMLVVDNDSTAAGSRALDLRVEPGRAPINVNADAGRAANLNADKVDGKGADQIGVNGLEVVSTTSDATDSSSPKTVAARCPDGKVVIGTSYEILGATDGGFPDLQSNVVLASLQPAAGTSTVPLSAQARAEEEEPTSEDWTVTAIAICATEGTP